MAAVKAPYAAEALLPRSFSPVPDSPWPNSAMTPSNGAAHNNIFPPNGMSGRHLAVQPQSEEAVTPSDITAPSPSTSETSTVFTDVDGEEEPQSALPQTIKTSHVASSNLSLNLNLLRSPATSLKIDTTPITDPYTEEDEPPQSVIHVPSGFSRFHQGHGTRSFSRLSQSHVVPRSNRSASQSSSTSAHSSKTEPAGEPLPPPERPSTAASTTTESTAPSESTLRPESEAEAEAASADVNIDQPTPQAMGSPLQAPSLASKDWASTPRAQTRQELSFSRPGSSLASIREGDDDSRLDLDAATEASADDLEAAVRERLEARKIESEIQFLEDALAECWTLCNTLQSLSNRHRDRMFLTGRSSKGNMHEMAWKTCWKLCQNLYEAKDIHAASGTKATLTLCRELCQALFDVRIRKDDTADSVLRVSFELNNHLFNTHDRTLPEAFRERTLEFYVTLCHRLMKQKSKLAQESDALLRTCWTLAEMLFTLRQSRRENRRPDQELLSNAMQACWDLCDLFREGWTQVRPDRGTPRATQTTFSEAVQLAKQAGYIEDQNSLKFTPETPTTIFDDTATISPDEAPPPPTISVMNNGIPQSAISTKSTASAPPAFPRPNTTQRMTRVVARQSQNRWGSINEVVAEEDTLSRPTSALSQSSRASSSHRSVASSVPSSQHTITTPAEDPSLTLLKALFVRAAVQTGRGFAPDPRNNTSGNAMYTSLPLFVRSLPDNAFGNQERHRNLLEHYKKTVAQDSTFKHLGTTAMTIGLGADPEKGKEDIATVLKGMVDNTTGWSWLRDLFKYGYGSYVDEIIMKSKEVPAAPTVAKTPKDLPRGMGRNNTIANSNSNLSTGNEGKKISPSQR